MEGLRLQALVSLREGTGKEGMGLCLAREGLRKDHLKAAEGAGCFPEEGIVCSKTPRWEDAAWAAGLPGM